MSAEFTYNNEFGDVVFLHADMNNAAFHKEIVGLAKTGLVTVIKKHKVGRYEMIPELIPLEQVKSIALSTKLAPLPVLAMSAAVAFGVMALIAGRWLTGLALIVPGLLGVLMFLGGLKRQWAKFQIDGGKKVWFSRLPDGDGKAMVSQIVAWADEHGIEIENRPEASDLPTTDASN